MYCEDGDVGTAIVMQVITEMLQAGVLETTLQAFNVLFNLTVHLQMLEEVPFFDFDGQCSMMQPLYSLSLMCPYRGRYNQQDQSVSRPAVWRVEGITCVINPTK